MRKAKYMAMSCDGLEFSCRVNLDGSAYIERNGVPMEVKTAEELISAYWRAGHTVNIDGRVYPGLGVLGRIA